MSVRKALILAAIGLAALFWWLATPPTDVAFDDSCEPDGIRASISSRIDAQAFWKSQLAAARKDRIKLEQAPEKMAQINAMIKHTTDEANAYWEDFYLKHPELRPPRASKDYQLRQQAEQLRKKADAIERAELDRLFDKYRLRRIATLQRCEQKFGRLISR